MPRYLYYVRPELGYGRFSNSEGLEFFRDGITAQEYCDKMNQKYLLVISNLNNKKYLEDLAIKNGDINIIKFIPSEEESNNIKAVKGGLYTDIEEFGFHLNSLDLDSDETSTKICIERIRSLGERAWKFFQENPIANTTYGTNIINITLYDVEHHFNEVYFAFNNGVTFNDISFKNIDENNVEYFVNYLDALTYKHMLERKYSDIFTKMHPATPDGNEILSDRPYIDIYKHQHPIDMPPGNLFIKDAGASITTTYNPTNIEKRAIDRSNSYWKVSIFKPVNESPLTPWDPTYNQLGELLCSASDIDLTSANRKLYSNKNIKDTYFVKQEKICDTDEQKNFVLLQCRIKEYPMGSCNGKYDCGGKCFHWKLYNSSSTS